jgi:hypothetical protein
MWRTMQNQPLRSSGGGRAAEQAAAAAQTPGVLGGGARF